MKSKLKEIIRVWHTNNSQGYDDLATEILNSLVLDEEKIASILYPLCERVHNITHSYMNKQIYEADCRNKQIEELNKTAQAIAKSKDVIKIKEG